MTSHLKPLAAILPLLFIVEANAAERLAALDPVVVTATRQAMKASEVLSDITVLEREDLERAGQSTLEEVLARQPGIEFMSNGSQGATTSLFFRGTNSKHVLLLVDGMRVGSATAGDVSWSRIPLAQIERVEIVRGPASSLYGADALGGVVQVFTRQSEGPARFFGEAGVGSHDTYTATGGVSGSRDGWRYALNASTYRARGFNSQLRTTGKDNDRDGFDSNSVSGRIAYEFAKGHEAGAHVFHSDGENKYDAGRDDRNQLTVSSFNTFLRNRITQQWTSTLSLGQSIDDARNTGTYNTTYKTEQTQYAWQNDVKTGFGTFLLGAERLDQTVSSTTAYQLTSRTNDSAQLGWLGNYQAHRLQLNARYDDNSQFGDKATGSAAYGYQFDKHWRANVSYGTAFRAPSFNDLYWPFTSYGAWGTYQGNPNLQPEFAHNREAALHYDNGQHRVSVTWFLNRVQNLIASSGGFNAMPVNIGNARLEGIGINYAGRIGSFILEANYNHQDPRNSDTDKLLARRARNFGSLAVGQAVGPWDWRMEYQASGYRFDEARNNVKLDGYALLNLYGAYRFERDWSVFARVNNLFDRDYVVADGYATPGVNVFVGIRYAPK